MPQKVKRSQIGSVIHTVVVDAIHQTRRKCINPQQRLHVFSIRGPKPKLTCAHANCLFCRKNRSLIRLH